MIEVYGTYYRVLENQLNFGFTAVMIAIWQNTARQVSLRIYHQRLTVGVNSMQIPSTYQQHRDRFKCRRLLNSRYADDSQ